MNSGGGSVTCVLCPEGFIQSLDGFNCVACDDDCKNCAQNGGYRTDSNPDGSPIKVGTNLVSRCIRCDKASSLPSVTECVSCKPIIFAESANVTATTCDAVSTQIGGLLFVDTTASNQEPSYFSVAFGAETNIFSWYSTQYLLAAYRTCRLLAKRNVTACQLLGNICVLNLYNYLSNSVDACRAFDSILATNGGSTTAINAGIWSDNMPWLNYVESYNSYLLNYDSAGTNDASSRFIKLTFDNKCNTQVLGFYGAQYALSGELLRFGLVDITEFQLCNRILGSAARVSPFSATNFDQSCMVTAQALLDFGDRNSIFYDLYLKYSAGSNMLPVALKILNFLERASGAFVNRLSDTRNQRLQRRFFLVDSVSSRQSQTGQPRFVRYAKSITLRVDLVGGQTDGIIYPPVFIIDYDYIPTSDLTRQVKLSFKIEYRMNLDTQVIAIWISTAILCVFVIVWTFFRTWIWNKRTGMGFDTASIFKFFMYLCSGLANVFILVAICVALYWLIFFKGQVLAFVLIPQTDQEASFLSLIVIGFSLKLFDIIHLILVQASYNIFFIDWERPKNSEDYANQLVSYPIDGKASKPKGESEEKLIKEKILNRSSVSCWRTLFVANEWNEIQTFRKINPTIQLIMVLLLLKVVNLEAFTTSDCNTSVIRDPNQYQAPYSGILRVAMAASMYLGVGLFQWLIYHFFYTRCISDKLGQFVDFCSVANISMFIMTHKQYGFYIHGRSPHGNADTSMQQMSLALEKENNNNTATRGLKQGSDVQTFSISVSEKINKEYSKIVLPLNNVIYKKNIFLL